MTLDTDFRAIAHLTAVLAKQPQNLPMQAGKMITTGTVTAALSVDPGESRQIDLEGIALPGLAVQIVM